RGRSLLRSPVRLVPAVKGLFGRVRYLAVLPPCVQAVVDDESRQMGERRIGGGDRRAIGGGLRQQRAGGLHHRLFGERHLIPLHEYAPPRIDLLVDVNLHRADIAAAAVERGGKWQVAVLPRVEGRIDDKADWAGISGPVAQTAEKCDGVDSCSVCHDSFCPRLGAMRQSKWCVRCSASACGG